MKKIFLLSIAISIVISLFAQVGNNIDTTQINIPIKIGFNGDAAISDTTSTLIVAEDQQANLDYNDGVQLYQQGLYEPAIQNFTKALTLNPNLTKAYYGRGSSYMQLQNYQKALDDLTIFCTTSDKDGNAIYLKGYCQYYLEKYERNKPVSSTSPH